MLQGILLAVLGVGIVTAGLVFEIRRRRTRSRRENERAIVYTNVAQRQQLSHLQEMAPPHVRDRIRSFGRSSEVNNVLLGKDIDGTFYVARTGTVGADEPVLLFEAKRATKLDGLNVELTPEPALQSLARKIQRDPGPVSSRSTQSRLRWEIGKATELDETTMTIAGRIVESCRAESESTARLDLAVSVSRGQVLIHCNGPLQLSMTGEFVERARRLRTEILDTLNNAGTTRWNASRSHQTVDMDALDAVVDRISPDRRPQSPHSGALVSLDEILDTANSRETSVTH